MKMRNLLWNNAQDIEFIIQNISNGKVFVGTSDTVLGLLARASSQGLEKLNTIKGRMQKPYIILIKSPCQIPMFSDCTLSPACQLLVKSCWPGPLTVILKAKSRLAAEITGPDGTVALRVPAHAGLQHVLQKVPALFSTSANKAGCPVPSRITDIETSIIESVAGTVTDSQENSVDAAAQPSTIIDCTGPEIRLVREGAYDRATLESICHQKIIS